MYKLKGCNLKRVAPFFFVPIAKAMKQKTICKVLAVAMLLLSCTAFVLSFYDSAKLLSDYLDIVFKLLLCVYLWLVLWKK